MAKVGNPIFPTTSSLQTDTTSHPIISDSNIMCDLSEQIRYLLEQDDLDSLRFLISDESQQALNDICSRLTQKQAARVRKIYREVKIQQGFDEPAIDPVERNRLIDAHLQRKAVEEPENILDMISRHTQKLVYEEHFGFPFYDLFKRMLSTLGDFLPQIPTIKTIHSQILILYTSIFNEEYLAKIIQKTGNIENALKGILNYIFPTQYEQFYSFSHVYKNLKRQTEQGPTVADDEGEGEPPPAEDVTLGIQEKEFLVNLAQRIHVEQFQQFNRNRTYNFMCFGMKKYQSFIGLDLKIYETIKEKQFCELLSFISVRFVRKIIFTIIRQRNKGVLANLTQSITPLQIKRIGNEFIDNIAGKIAEFSIPEKTIDEIAFETFMHEFQTSSYKDFISHVLIKEAEEKNERVSQYVWEKSKQFRKMWVQRIKSQQIFDNNGQKQPNLDYLTYIYEKRQEFLKDRVTLWKQYIMMKLGFQVEEKKPPRKRVKLQSLND